MRKHRNYWTEEKVREKAIECKDKADFKKKYSAAYKIACKLKIINDLLPGKTKPNKYWTEANVRKEASKYKTRLEFSKKCGSAYLKAIELKIMDDLGFDILGNRIKRCIYAIEFSDRSAYIGLTFNFEQRIYDHFNKYSRSSSARKYFEENKNLQYNFIKLTDYLDKNIAVDLEKHFIDEYRKNNWNILNKMVGGGLGGSSGKWSEQLCLETFCKYESRKELLASKDKGAYYYAYRHNLLDIMKFKVE